MTHTPGPWKVGYSLFDKTRVTCVATEHSVLLESSRMYGREETEANMRLCAAAPEMFEALVQLADNSPTFIDAGDWPELRVALETAYRVIAKAKGDE